MGAGVRCSFHAECGIVVSFSRIIFLFHISIFGKDKKIRAITVISFCLSAVIVLFLDATCAPIIPPCPSPPDGEFWAIHVCLQFPIVRLPEFCLGICAAKYFFEQDFKSSTQLEALFVGLLIIFIASANYIREILSDLNFSHFGLWVNQCWCMFIFAGMITVFAKENGKISKILSHKQFVALGEMSFSIYLVHFVVLSLLHKINIQSHINFRQFVYIITILSVYFASYFCKKYIEIPGECILKNMLKK